MSEKKNIHEPMVKGILTDVTKCIGCERCVEGCVAQHHLPADPPTDFKADDGLSAYRYTSIIKIPGKKPGEWRMVRRQCMHCDEPSCAAVCLVSAFDKNPDGSVTYNADKCIGCRYCMLGCPFSNIRYQYDKPVPYIGKCKMSEECRVEGGMPACVSACPTGATIYGPREQLIAEAKRRIAENPDKYINYIYGEHDFGGTSVIYISDVPLNDAINMPSKERLEELRVPELHKKSIPHLLHSWVIVTPIQFVVVAASLFGIKFLQRRSRLMLERAQEKQRQLESKNTGSEE
jgi:formate dehydrogenase iron-sulfur subunit